MLEKHFFKKCMFFSAQLEKYDQRFVAFVEAKQKNHEKGNGKLSAEAKKTYDLAKESFSVMTKVVSALKVEEGASFEEAIQNAFFSLNIKEMMVLSELQTAVGESQCFTRRQSKAAFFLNNANSGLTHREKS